MRNGVLVAEGSPQSVINKYETDSLEAAFLALCSGRDQNRVKLHFMRSEKLVSLLFLVNCIYKCP